MELRGRIAAMVAVAACFWGLTRCADEAEFVKDEGAGELGKEDRWNRQNDPARFALEFKYKVEELPRSGQAERLPWSDHWFPMRKDGFNQRWQGTSVLSPLEKYDQAFNGWTPTSDFLSLRPFSYPGSAWDRTYYAGLGPAAGWESQFGGNTMARNDVDDDRDGSTDEADDWDGLGGWWGKCHMWAGVSVVAPEPQRPVTINGVTFEHSDITALIMEAYFNRSRSYFLGERCNDREIARDERGRPTNTACRDTNAGSFHIIVTNMLGVHRRAFVMDKSGDEEVWNHPVRDYEITGHQEVTLAQALRLLGLPPGETYPFNPDARRFYEVRMTLGYVSDSMPPGRRPQGSVRVSARYHYLLELDAEDRIIGGEWIGEEGPDFFWLPVMSTYGRGGNPHVKFAHVETLVRLSTQPETPPAGNETRVESASGPLPIPDNNPAGATSTINVTSSGRIGTLRAALRIRHTFVGDLRIDLRHGDRAARIYNGDGGSAHDLFEEIVVPDFAGDEVGGAWDLIVTDTANVDTGTIEGWALVYTPAEGGSPAPGPRTVTGGSSTRIEIPDNRPEGVTSTISVADRGTVRGLTLAVEIRHPFVGDLKVEMRRLGTGIVVHDRVGGSSDDIVREFTLADFNGVDVAGDWSLVVSDNARRDVGHLVSWSIRAVVE